MKTFNKISVYIVKFYQKRISSGTRSRCIYIPSCSNYALDAFKKRSFFVAVFLVIKRLLRCNPLRRGGFDPVPDSKNVLKWLV
ncbi:MAG: membrane protein insertion efficiency factor YidD [Clostridia bacterium]|nr:membrane protein insertion efficiency factor YidD [Clostridia bacterium]